MKLKVKYFFDYECSPLWSVDNRTMRKYGYNILDLKELGLSGKAIKLIEYNCEMFNTYLNPIYPGFPSFWSGRMQAFFQYSIKFLYEQILVDIGEVYDVENREVERFDEKVDIEQIDKELMSFVDDPAQFASQYGISFNSNKELRNEVQSAYKDWGNREFKYYTI